METARSKQLPDFTSFSGAPYVPAQPLSAFMSFKGRKLHKLNLYQTLKMLLQDTNQCSQVCGILLAFAEPLQAFTGKGGREREGGEGGRNAGRCLVGACCILIKRFLKHSWPSTKGCKGWQRLPTKACEVFSSSFPFPPSLSLPFLSPPSSSLLSTYTHQKMVAVYDYVPQKDSNLYQPSQAFAGG